MKISKIKKKKASDDMIVADIFIDDGYLLEGHASMPDIDIDYASDGREAMKNYIADRYNHDGTQNVFSAGTFTTFKIKQALKDIGKNGHGISLATLNYVSSMISNKDADMSWTEFFRECIRNKRMREFVKDYPEVIESIRNIQFQPKTTSIHASAVIITPKYKNGERVECFDYVPICKNEDGLLFSEYDGYAVDDIGLLKCDVLSTKELMKIRNMLNLINENYPDKVAEILRSIDSKNNKITMKDIHTFLLKDTKVYDLFSNGHTQNIFQFSGKNITKFVSELMPSDIEDIIAANALYRPATIEIKDHENYIKFKKKEAEPVYDFGTFDTTKNTYGIYCIAKGSKVNTKKGKRNIENVNVGDMVLTEDGTYQEVTNKKNNGVKRTVLVRTSFGRQLNLTPDHKVLTQYGWVEAGDLTSSHLVKGFFEGAEKRDIGTIKDWCLGLYLADGCSSGSNITIACSSKDFAQRVCDIFNSEFDTVAFPRFHTRCWHANIVAKKDKNGYFRSDHKENKFRSYLKEFGLLGETKNGKFLPKNSTLSTLVGFIEGDGCLANNRIRLKNRRMAIQVYELLQSYRIYSSYYEDDAYSVQFNDIDGKLNYIIKDFPNRKLSGSPLPIEYIDTIDASKLSKIERSNSRKCRANNKKTYTQYIRRYNGKISHGAWGVVLKVDEAKDVEVWDLSVKNNHSFIVGGLTVHNCYQEQYMKIAEKLGGFPLAKCDVLRKAIGKKRADIMESLKSDFKRGAIANGCPKEDADSIWHKIELAGKYSFNRSHAAAYALTAYDGAWATANFPTAAYSVALQECEEDEIKTIMGEMQEVCNCEVVPPNVNVSGMDFFTDFNTDQIFWSIAKIKFVGAKAIDLILEDRKSLGEYSSFKDFYMRITARNTVMREKAKASGDRYTSPVNSRVMKNMILSGCFDEIEHVKALADRYFIIEQLYYYGGGAVDTEKEFTPELISKHYFWSMKQIELSGLGSVDYRRVYNSSEAKVNIKRTSYLSLKDVLNPENEDKRCVICGTVLEVEERSGKTKDSKPYVFGKVKLQQNNDIVEYTLWNDSWEQNRGKIMAAEGKIMICNGTVRYGDYNKTNAVTGFKKSVIEII